ncbi:MAG TPA: T9SS type A sorting domain-containing protein [Hanamia sp.]
MFSWYTDIDLTNKITTPSSYTSGSSTVYAKVASNTDTSVYSKSAVTLTVNTTPAAPTLSKEDKCDGTSIITATGLVSGATLTWSDGGSGNPRSVSTTTSLTVTQTKNTCTSAASNSVTPAPKTTPAAPTLSKEDKCDGTSTITATGLVSGATLNWSDGGSGNPRTVSSTTSLTVTQTVSGCTSGASNSITPAPKTTPTAPTVSVVNNCDGSSDLTADNYTGSLLWSNTATTASIHVTNAATYTVTQTVNGCTSLSGSGTSAPKTTPVAPSICVVQPSLCGPTTGSISILSPTGAGFEYSIDNGENWQTDTDFSNLAPGSVSGIKVKNADGCISTSVNCDASNCSPTETVTLAPTQSIKIADDQTTVKAFPNPFNDKVKFVVNTTQSGNGTLEIFNMLGQKIKTVYHGYMPAGVNNFDLNLPGQKNSNLIYRFSLGTKLLTGKLLQINK